MAEHEPTPAPPARPASRPRRPWRDNLEAFGVAILMAVLLKPFLIEAYQIPTSSMQPTLMGSPEAGIYDRILVDKQCYELFEPERWDIVVFRYPIRRNQNYVKRIVGVPGDRLRIAGGNLWQVGADGEIEGVVRKPERIQERLWKEIYPARRLLDRETAVLGEYFGGQAGVWREDGGALVVTPSTRGKTRLSYTDRGRGVSNQLYDGYGVDVARTILEEGGGLAQREGVQDVRLSFEITPAESPAQVTVECRLQPPGRPGRALRLQVENGTGRLVILSGSDQVAASEPFACAVPAGATTALAFAHVDGRLLAWRDGEQVGELEVGEHRLAVPLDPAQVVLTLETQGGGEQRFSGLRVERDLHYVATGLDDALDRLVPPGVEKALPHHVIEVPEGHYFMMGDNTLASADSRQWQVLTIGMSRDGRLVNPKTHPEARVLRGNRRPWNLDGKPDNDENPVVLRFLEPQRIVFTDDDGEVFVLEARLDRNYTERDMRFVDSGGDGARIWVPVDEHVFFVPREHVLGRPLVTFWPPSRIGFIR